MQALTLHQPYASLIAFGLKPWETRKGSVIIPRGVVGERIAIHAGISEDSLKWLAGQHVLSARFRAALHEVGAPVTDLSELPRGAVVATARLAGAWRVRSYSRAADLAVIHAAAPGSDGRAVAAIAQPASASTWRITTDLYGDYGPGRWVILLTDVERLASPAPARGYQGFWQWREQEALL